MSNNRSKSGSREINQHITNCEPFLSKALNRKYEDARPATRDKGRNEPARRSQLQETTRHRTTTAAGLTTTNRAPTSANRAQDGVKKAAAQRESAGKRATFGTFHDVAKQNPVPCSRNKCVASSRVCPCARESEKTTVQRKPTHHVYIPPYPVQPERTIYAPVPHTPQPPFIAPTRQKQTSWGEVLSENKFCGVHKPSVYQQSDHLKVPAWPASSMPQSHAHNHYLPSHDPRHVPSGEGSASTDNSSGFSSNTESVDYTDKSIQCSSPYGELSKQVLRAPSAVSRGTTSSYEQEEPKKKAYRNIDTVDTYEMYDPVRTLNFLLKELQDNLVKGNEEKNIHKILSVMERVVLRLPAGKDSSPAGKRKHQHQQHQQQQGRGKPSQASLPLAATKPPLTAVMDAVPVKETLQAIHSTMEETLVHRALGIVPLLTRRMDAKATDLQRKLLEVKPHCGVPSPPPPPAPLPAATSVVELQHQLEVSCHKLEAMCEAMSRTFDELRTERDKFEQEVRAKATELKLQCEREQEHVTAVKTLRTNLESTTRRVSHLTMENSLLQEQVQVLPALRDSEAKLKQLTAEVNQLREETKAKQMLSEIVKRCADSHNTKESTHARREAKKYWLRCLMQALPKLQARSEEMQTLQRELEQLRNDNEKLLRMQQQTKSTAEENRQLQEENKVLAARNKKLKEEKEGGVSVIQRALQEATERGDQLAQEAQLLRLERERLLLMNRSKNDELVRLHVEIGAIKSLVVQQLLALRSADSWEFSRNAPLPPSTSLSGSFSGPPSLGSSSPPGNSAPANSEAAQAQPAGPRTGRPTACSSPTTTCSESSQVQTAFAGKLLNTTSEGVARSWDEISSIPADSGAEPEVDVMLPPRDLQESEASGFHSVAADASWAAAAAEAEPGPRPPSRRGGPRPAPPAQLPQSLQPLQPGSGSAAAELQQHVLALFSLLELRNAGSRPGGRHPPSLASLGPDNSSVDSIDMLLARMDQCDRGDHGQM